MNSNGGGPYPGFAPQGPVQPPHQGINPAMLASFNGQQQQTQFNGALSPAQLLNGGMGGGMITPGHLLQQQQQQQMMMNSGLNGGLSSSGMHFAGGGMSMNNNGPSMMNPQMQAPPMQMSPQIQQALANMGVTREQIQQMNPLERQSLLKNVMAGVRQQQIQQQQAQQQQLLQQQYGADTLGLFDRPGSAMGMSGMGVGGGMGMNNMGMMPPQRPGTAQGMAGMRPGTGMGMHQPMGGAMGMNMGMGVGMGMGINPSMNPANMGMGGGVGPMGMGPRPPSRAASLGSVDFPLQNQGQQNGFQPGKSQSAPQFGPGFGGSPAGMPQPQQPQQNAAQGSPPPGSPYTRSKRKLAPSESQTQSPRISAMGPPPPMLRSTSAAGPGPRPPSANGTPQRQPSFGPQSGASGVQTPQRQPSIPRSASPMKPGTPARVEPPAAAPPPTAVPQITALTAAALPNVPPPIMPPSVARPPPPQPLLPPLPASVNLNPAVTRVTVVPLATSLAAIPPVSAEEIADVKEWMAADRAYELRFREMKTRMGAELREIVGPRTIPWWEKGTLDTNASRFLKGRERFDVRYPYRKKDKDREYHHRKGARREGIRLPRKIETEDANRPEQLVPIRLEFDVEHHKMRDTFVWNLNDPVISPEDFAQTVVEDYNLASSYHGVITKAIQDQLSDYRAHSANYDGDSWDVAVTEDTLRAGTLEGESAAWWSAWRKRLRSGRAAATGKGHKHKRRKVVIEDEDEDDDMEAADERPMTVEEFTFDQKALTDDMRILVKLDIIVGSIKLDDQFEWDLDNNDASPEGFADLYAKELGLGGEFKTAIAHSIREQVQTYQKSLFLVGRPTDGSPVQDDDLRNALMPSLSSASRAMDQVQAFTPQLNYLSDGELERNEKERDKDMNRRRKRTRGGRRGVALPDREPIRTCRTPSIGFPELDAATLAVVAAATAPTRRAAAAAASLTIANMVASENGERDYTPTSSLPPVPMPPPLVIKEKTAKGFFKPPPYDTSVLRPRAKVRAPIESTAADISKLPPPLENDPPPAPTSSVVPPGKAAGLKRGRDDRVFADGQRRNMINGVWHCSNCGCPESIAVGRRKGPLGDKSQCGTCGKYWHRHRRPRPIDYNSDLEHHATLKRAAEYAKTMAKRKGGAAALRAQGGTVPATPADTSEAQTPRDTSRQSPTRDLSPISDASSGSEAPLAQTVKLNGVNHANITPPLPPPPKQEPAPVDPPPPANLPAPTPAPVIKAASNPPDSNPPAASLPPPPASPLPPSVSTPTLASASPPPPEPVSVSAPSPAVTTPAVAPPPTQLPTSAPASVSGPTDGSPVPPPSPRATWPPQWLSNAMQAMQAKWRNDKFEVILRKVNSASTPEWRIKCLDCPGKLYTPGPGETLSNYEVHLKNRLHRQRVNDRMGNSATTTTATS